MIEEGYIKISRKSIQDPLYLSEPFTKWQAWCDLVMLARFSDGEIVMRGMRFEAKRGCVYTSSNELSKRWQWSRGKVIRFLDEMETIQQIVQVKSFINTCISICSYDEYQCGSTSDGTSAQESTVQAAVQVAVQVKKTASACESVRSNIDYQMDGTSDGTSDDTSEEQVKKENKKEEKKKEPKKNNKQEINKEGKETMKESFFHHSPPKRYETIDFSFVDESFIEPFFEWLQYKTERKDKKYTERGLLMAYKKLVSLSGGDGHTAMQIVEQSEANNWMGLFSLNSKDEAHRASRPYYGREEQRTYDRQLRVQGYAEVAAAFRRQSELDGEVREQE